MSDVGKDAIEQTWDAVVGTARRTAADGLVVGTSGNVSARVGDMVPTSELPLHLAVYRHTDAAAVVHTHAVHATAVSTLVTEVPLVHYAAALLGGPVRTAAYARYGTRELADHMLTALRDR